VQESHYKVPNPDEPEPKGKQKEGKSLKREGVLGPPAKTAGENETGVGGSPVGGTPVCGAEPGMRNRQARDMNRARIM